MFRFSYDSGLNGNSGVYGQSGLYDKSGLYAVEFNLQNLDPYLLFDTSEGSMIGTLENPTLDLDPSNPDSLDVITATRSSVATRTLPDGSIALAQQDTVRVDYTQGAELTPTKYQNFNYTDFANPYWIARGFTKVGTVDGPLGYTGYEFLENDSHSNPGILASGDLSDGSFQTFGVWLKSSSPISIALATTGSNKTSTINITTEWQFFSCTDNFNSTSGPHIGGFVTITQGSGVTLFAAMPQLEEGTTATTFVENTTGSPKFTGISATYAARVPMILVEPSATNLLSYSEDFSNAAWTKLGEGTGVAPTVTPDFGTSPDGTVSASRVQFNKGSGTTTGDQSTIFDAEATSSGATTSKSVYLKSNTNEAYEMVIYEVTNASGTNVKKITVTPDWQRFDVYGAVSSTTTGIAIGLREINVSGLSNTADVLVWGAQLEAGSVATSYIPTSGGDAAARTRAADDLVISGSDFDFYNQSEGTTYMEVVPEPSASTSVLFEYMDESAGANEIMGSYLTSGTSYFYAMHSGSFVANASLGTTNLSELNRIAVSYKVNDMFGSINGATSFRYTSLVLPTGIDKLVIGNDNSGNLSITGRIRRLIYWPTHSSRL